MRKGEVRDCNVDYLLGKIYIPATDLLVGNGGGGTGAVTPSATFSIGSPTYARVSGGRIGGLLFTATTTRADYLWRVPSEVDKNHPIYFRHHWSSQVSGLTPSVTFNMFVATLSSASSLVSSPTSVLNTAVPLSSNAGATGTPWVYNLTGRGAIAPIATGLAANQVMLDTVEALHLVIHPVSTNWAIATNNLIWLGMDIEYTPRNTVGDGSRREGRKLETNLGFQSMGPVNDY